MNQPQISKNPAPAKVKGKGSGPVHADGQRWSFINVRGREKGPPQQARTQFGPSLPGTFLWPSSSTTPPPHTQPVPIPSPSGRNQNVSKTYVTPGFSLPRKYSNTRLLNFGISRPKFGEGWRLSPFKKAQTSETWSLLQALSATHKCSVLVILSCCRECSGDAPLCKGDALVQCATVRGRGGRCRNRC